MISIITISNDKSILEEYLLKSLKKQTVDYELIVIDNINNKQFSHATKALNYGSSLVKGDYLMFVHQDVALWGSSFLEKFEKMLRGIADIGVGGVAGMTQRGQPYLFLKNDGVLSGSLFMRPIKVQTLDEMLLVVPRHVFDIASFDDNLPGWHCYGADYCLEVEKLSLSAYILPFFVHHRSAGLRPKGLIYSLNYMRDKWRRRGIYHGSWRITEGGDIIYDKGERHRFMTNPFQYALIRELLDHLFDSVISRKTSLFFFPINHSEDTNLPLKFTIEKLDVYDSHTYPITVVVANPEELSRMVKEKYNIAYVIPPKQGVDIDKATSAVRLVAKRVIVRRRHANLIWLYFWRLFS